MPPVFASHCQPGTPGYLGHLVPAGTVPYALQSLPGEIWLKIVDHTGRHNGLRRTCRKLRAIIPAVYRAKVSGSEDLGCFTEFLRSRVGHLYGVDVIAHGPWPRSEIMVMNEIMMQPGWVPPEWDKFCAASTAFVAVLAQCPDLHVLLSFDSSNSEAMKMLKDSAGLRTLTLDLRDNKMSGAWWDEVTQALGMLKDSTTLCTLTLTIRSGVLVHAGARWCTGPGDAEGLHGSFATSLSTWCWCTGPGDAEGPHHPSHRDVGTLDVPPTPLPPR